MIKKHFNFFTFAALAFFTQSFLLSCSDEDDDTFETVIVPPSTISNNVSAIDLGLPSGTKWANMNIGAQAPEDYGLYFAWGETVGYSENVNDQRLFDFYNYKLAKGNTTSDHLKYSRYVLKSSNGTVDNKSTLSNSDDAAYANWGSDWCMPTETQVRELINKTISEWTTVNGVHGRKFTSKKNGNSIFIPAAGVRNDNWIHYRGLNGYYWSSELSTSSFGRVLCFESDLYLESTSSTNKNPQISDLSNYESCWRYWGLTIRPVHK